ncbi:protein RETICULATA-RELATED 5, chloroplastic-like [Oryza brachyantha]|uniref:protein RETICULATA-RELATED 5, chloroplastic-like n=1 Tax=Oryza brachyantha TaxID=4533 RepID=UPI001ADC9E0F|nr:protein RETICULATA-RELATED 5, chloroplastic-like [Oryza brachyantha]
MMAAEPSPAASSAAAAEDLETLPLDSSYSSAPATDPLLRPPASPAAAATVVGDHDPFVIDDEFVVDDDDDIAPEPAPAAPPPAEARGPEFARIVVSDPKKHAEPTAGASGVIPGSGSYFSYLVTTRLAESGDEVRVRRRFRDVVALADRLAAAHRGLFIPTRPDKSVVEGQVMQRHDFVNQRCSALQRYLRRLAAHPVVGHSPDLRTFLTEPGAIPAFEGEAPRYWTTTVSSIAPSAPVKAGRDLFGMFKGLKQTVVNGMVATKPPPVVEETDTVFLEQKARLQDLQQQLTTTSQQAEALVKARDDLKTSTAHLGMTLIKLAKFEREQATCSPQRRRAADINNFGNSVVKFSRSQAKLNSEIVKHLGCIHEYLETMISVHHAFTDRSNALHHVQSLSADLFFLHARAVKLESLPSRTVDQQWERHHKIGGLKETISATEAEKSHAVKEYENIKENNMIEIRRFDKDRRRDFVEMLKGFIVNQVSYSDHYANMWAKVAEETKAVGRDARVRVWEKLTAARVVYLGEAELVPDPDDRVLELEIVKGLATRCAEAERGVALALEAFPSDLQQQLDQFMDGRIDGSILKLYTLHWPQDRWEEYEPLLNYCRDTGIKLIACGTPLKVKRTVQADGIRGLSKADREEYAPPAGSGFISGFSSISGRSLIDKISSSRDSPFGPTSYLSAQARVVDDYTMSKIILKELNGGDTSRMLIVVAGASHVIYGSRGIGVPARVSKKMPKKDQVVVLLDPERQSIRREGEIPVADFLWYSAAKPCSRNCFDRAEIARVMNAAGRRPEGLPQDLQRGIDLGVVSPEILQNFFDLEKYPVMSELIHRFQGFRERLLADPKFLQRLAIEEAISITTTLLAQYERRKGRFFEEIDYVLTDTIRGSVVDFFTVWLPAPTISVLSYADDGSGESLEFVKGLLGSLPDNAFQKNLLGQNWNMNQRVAAVLVGGLKLASVGFISSVGAGASSDLLYAARRVLKPSVNAEAGRKRSPIWKSAAVYSCFLGTSANLRYQIIAGLVEYRLGETLATNYNQPLLASLLSFVARTVNSYWGTQQWVDLARYTGLQKTKELPPVEVATPPAETSELEDGRTEVQHLDDNSNQSNGRTE